MDVLGEILSHAGSTPDRLAVKDSARALSYGEIATEVSDIAAGLHALGVASNDRVAISMSTSVDAFVLALGCMMTGAVFVPISPADPPARLAGILADCAPVLVVVGADRGDTTIRGVPIETAQSIAEAGRGRAPGPSVGSGPTYCIFTSGTMGRPKGVLVGREALGCATEHTIDVLGLGTATKALCISSFHFDGSFATLFSVPAAGGLLVILRREPIVLPRMFVATVLEEQIDVTMCSPSFLRLLLASPSIHRLAGSSLRMIGFGGEASSPGTLLALFERLPGVRFFNRYGPTETVIAVSTFEITQAMVSERRQVPIGRPHPGVVFRIFDQDDALVERSGDVGELYIGGDQLMDGYIGDPELSARVLRTDLVPGEILYRTGDLVILDDHGDYVYVGRADRVVKRHGIRISLDELEEALRSPPQVTNAAVITTQDGDDIRIVGYVVAASTTEAELVARVRERLPATMAPDALTFVEDIPLTAAGKIDYSTLRHTHAA